jgi:hypothetical protein
MKDFTELSKRCPSNPLSRRIGGDQDGILSFKVLKFPEELVVFGIGDFWPVANIVQFIMSTDGFF